MGKGKDESIYCEGGGEGGGDEGEKEADVRWTEVEKVREGEDGEGEVGAVVWRVEAGGKSTERVVEFLKGGLQGLVRVEFRSVGEWL